MEKGFRDGHSLSQKHMGALIKHCIENVYYIMYNISNRPPTSLGSLSSRCLRNQPHLYFIQSHRLSVHQVKGTSS